MERFFLGCPIWGQKNWVGELFTRDARPADFLKQYASVFNTVEGNTTFYGMPTPATVERWRADTPSTFRFCFKFPRVISHDKALISAEAETAHFLDTLAPLDQRLGPSFLQLPPSFGPSNLPALEHFLSTLPPGYQYAVEVRHPTFFAGGAEEAGLDALLAAHGANRVCFDGRALRAAPGADPLTREAQRKKPDIPARFIATASAPFVRYIAHPDEEANLPYLEAWVPVIVAWLAEGRTPYFFMHAPDDFYAPRLARRFHELLRAVVPLPPMPRWPAEREEPPLEQLSLL
jgi:uncharacterized protein YecE (DUF72 family)